LSPARRRLAVLALRDRLGMSERRACRLAGQHRSTQRHQAAVADDDAALRTQLRRISRERPRWGYRRAHALLREDGWQLNIKRTRRVWREEGLRVPRTRRKRQRLGTSTVPADRLRAQRPDHVWAIDFQWDQTADGHNLKLLHVVDEFTREALAIECHRRIDADKTVGVLDRLVGERGTAPAFVRCDNGPELTANALRDWCRFTRAGSAYIDPGSPWQNAYVESFGGRIRDELLAVELFSCLTEARVLIEDWRLDYNHHRPHSALEMMAPAVFAASLRQPPSLPTATASGEGGDQRGQLPLAASASQPSIFPAVRQQSPAKEITSPQLNRRGSYRGATITSTQLSQQVDR
jgi:putative transposase